MEHDVWNESNWKYEWLIQKGGIDIIQYNWIVDNKCFISSIIQITTI